jgi:DNA helicase HerA-like ATPase
MITENETPNAQANGKPEPSRRLGTVCDGGLSTVKVLLEGDESGESATCEVGDYVLIPTSTVVVFGQVSAMNLVANESGGKDPVALVNLLNTIDFTQNSVSPGVAKKPALGGAVFLADPTVVRMVAESRAKKDGGAPKVSLDLARLADGHNTPVTITPEMLFGRHMAILGTTGGGKSYTLTRLVEEVAKHKSKTILFDPSGEFGAIESGALHVYLGKHPSPEPGMVEVVMPYSELTENDLFAIFKPSGESQAPKLRQAIKSLKLARLAPDIALDGYVIKANRTKQYYDEAYLDWVNEVESQNADFDITKLVRQIQNECVLPNRSSTETTSWGDINQIENSLCVTLVNRVQDIITSENLAPIFQPEGKRSIFEVIETFLSSEEHRVLVISMQYLSFEHNAREIVSNAAGRCLMSMARGERFRELPVLVCVDEAHQFLKEKMELNSEYSMDSFALIAKEGRKYGLHICIATQRPRDLPESVLSQVGSLIVHRLINDKDRGIIERACGEANASALSALPILTQGQAVLLGAEFPVPLVVKVQMPVKRPNARSADFQTNWAWPNKDDKKEEKDPTQVIYL